MIDYTDQVDNRSELEKLYDEARENGRAETCKKYGDKYTYAELYCEDPFEL